MKSLSAGKLFEIKSKYAVNLNGCNIDSLYLAAQGLKKQSLSPSPQYPRKKQNQRKIPANQE
jgi:hypothetical protein